MNRHTAAAIVLASVTAMMLGACSTGSAMTKTSPSATGLTTGADASFAWFAAGPAPKGWQHAELPDHTATLWFPPTAKATHSDKGTITYATVLSGGQYLLYLNATPKQGTESIDGWPQFRIDHLGDENAATVTLDAAATRLRFTSGTGSCVLDHYTTRVGAHRYREIACFVQGVHGSSVLVAATADSSWNSERTALEKAVDSYVPL